jgi:hypothetical protein
MKHIFLDTEVFRRENLAFDSVRFQRLADLVQEGEVEIYVTDVVEDEVRRAVVEQVRIGMQALRQEPIRRALNVIAGGGVPKLKDLLKEIDEGEIAKTLLKEFDELLDSLDATVVSTDGVPTKEIRERYFRVTPPFGHRAEKKHEFPDAISVIAIQAWAAVQTDAVVVVSGDKGIAAAVKEMSGVSHAVELRDVIDFVLRRMAIVEDPDALLKAKQAELQDRVKQQFEDLGFYVDGEWGEVVEVTVRSVDLGTAYLGDRKGDVITLEFEAEIKYSAELSFADPGQTAYDSETGDTYVFGSVSETVRDTTWVEGTVDIEINVNDLSLSLITSLFLAVTDVGVPAPQEPDYK